MSERFLDKYRIESSRKKGHDYTLPGVYFITINTDAQIHWFGSIEKGKIKLSLIGEMVREEWIKSESIRDNIQLDEYKIMSNHIHGIIIIEGTPVETARWAVSPIIKVSSTKIISTEKNASSERIVSSGKNASSEKIVSSGKTVKNKQYNRSQLKPNSLGSIIGQF